VPAKARDENDTTTNNRNSFFICSLLKGLASEITGVCS
jgi:hypothetical protein